MPAMDRMAVMQAPSNAEIRIMNRAYKVIWSAAVSAWVVVGEFAAARGKAAQGRRAVLAASTMLAGLVLPPQLAQATVYAPSNCNNGSAVGPDGVASGAGSAPSDGSGVWSNVIGCNANGGGFQGVQIMGYNARATGAGAVALGYASLAGARGTGVGMRASASGTASTALGQWTRATGTGSVAIGGNNNSNTADSGAYASGSDAIAIAGQSRAEGSESVAIGVRSRAARNGDVAIGSDALADGTSSNLSAVAIGRGSQAVGEDATALGNSSSAQAYYGTAVGNYATVSARNALALGNSSNASGVAATSIGNFSAASGSNAVAIGGGGLPGSFAGARASGAGAIALGGNDVRGAAAGAGDAIAIGGEAQVADDATSGIAIGRGAQVAGGAVNAIAQGDGALARNAHDIALGMNAATAANSSGSNIAIGDGASTGGQGQNVAIGAGGTMATAGSASGGAVAIGRNQRAVGDGAVALGDPNAANGTGAVALGADNTAAADAQGNGAADGAVAIGNGNQALGQGAVALGNRSLAAAPGALALGDGGQAQAARGIALGAGAMAANANDVALGAAAQTAAAVGTASAIIDGRSYGFAGTAPNSTVSIGSGGGERTLTNLAAGRISGSSTDAINGSQLYATHQAINTLSEGTVKYDRNADGTVNYESVTLNPGGNASRLGNVAVGGLSETSTDAVNGSQLYQTNQNVTQLGDTLTSIAGDTSQANTDANGLGIRYVRTNEAGLAQSDASAQGQGSTAVGYGATATGMDALALGRGARASVEGAIALGSGSVSARALTPDSGSIAVGSGGALVPFNTTDRTLLGAISVGSDSTYRQISNVADGSDAHDVVTVRQLTGAIASVTETGTRYFHANSTEDDSLAAGVNAVAIGPNTVVNGDDGIGIGNGAQVAQNAPGGIALGEQARSQLADSIAIGTQALANAEQGLAMGAASVVSVGGGVALGAGSIARTAAGLAGFAPTGTDTQGIEATRSRLAAVSVGDVDAGEFRQINGVAAGTVDSDAVNVSQLKAVNARIDGLADSDQGIRYFHANSQADDSQALGGDSLAIGPRAVAEGDSSIALGNGARAGAARAGAIGNGNQVDAEGAFAVGGGNTVAAANAFVLGNNVSILDDTLVGAVVLGHGSSVAAAQAVASVTLNGVQYAYAGAAPAAGDVVSVGAQGAERQIQNVAAGRVAATSTDAINGSQLYAAHQAIDAIGSTVQQITSGGGVKYFHANGGPNGVLADSQAVGVGAVAAGPGAMASSDGSTALGQDARAARAGDVALGSGAVADRGAERYTGRYSGAANSTAGTVSVGAAGAERSISNVADGRDATDAVNVRQLDGAVKQANEYTDQRISDVAGTVVEVGDRLDSIDGRVSNAEGSITRLQQGADGMFQVSPDVQQGAHPLATGRNAVAGGVGAVASGQNATAIGNAAVAGGNDATALGQGAQATGSNSVALGSGSQATRDNSVAVGSEGRERQVTHVAAGTAGTDAVNLNQLRALESGVGEQLAGVRRDAQRLDNRLSAGVAAAMAMSALPQAYLPGRSMMSMGGATWRGESGMAMGLSTVSDNGRWVMKGQASSTTRGDFGASVGVGFQW